jgi:glycosyltransferase involved in cell wall biosynthesis
VRGRIASTLRGRGINAYRRHEYVRATRWLKASLRLEMNEVAALYLARAHRERRQHDESLRTIEVLLAVSPRWQPALNHAIEELAKLGRDDCAWALLMSSNPVGELAPDELESLLRRATPGAPETASRLALELLDREVADPPIGNVFTALPTTDNGRSLAGKLTSIGTEPALAEAVKVQASSGRLEAARSTARNLRTCRSRSAREAASMLHRYGFSHDALMIVGAASADDSTAASIRRRIEAQLKVLGGWRPRLEQRRLRNRDRRVLHISQSSVLDRRSGYTIRTHEIARAQRKIGWQASVVALSGYGADSAGMASGEENVDGVPYLRLGIPDAREMVADTRLAANAEHLLELVDAIRPRVLHAASDYQNALVALSLRDATGIPVIYEARGFWEETWLGRQPAAAANSSFFRLRREVNVRVMREADHVVTLSDPMKAELVARGVSSDAITVVPNGVDPERLRPVGRDRALAASLRIDREQFCVGYVGTLIDYEGLGLLIEAVGQLRRQSYPIQCLIVGSGPAEHALRSLLGELHLDEHVRIVGEVAHEDIARYYALLDAFAMPRVDLRVCNLVTPLKPFEAIATMTPLVVSDVKPLRELVVDGSYGVVARAGDASSLADSLRRLIENPLIGHELAEAAASALLPSHTWKAAAQAYGDLYSRVAPGGSVVT